MTSACAAAASPWPSTSRPRPPIWPGSSTKPAPGGPRPGTTPGTPREDGGAAPPRRGLEVHALHGADPATFDQHLLRTLDTRPDLILDDGAELVARLPGSGRA